MKSNVGYGEIQYADGSSYSGGIKDFKRHGTGTLNLSNGKTIEGVWSSNINVEDATVIDEYGFQWSGTIKNMKPNGRMQTVRPDGITYDSFWQSGYLLQSLSVNIVRKH